MSLQEPLERGSQHPYVLTLQSQLLALGFDLPRFGADGILGQETLTAYRAFLNWRGQQVPSDEVPQRITVAGAAALEAAHAALAKTKPIANMIDERAKHPHDGRSTSMPFHPWDKISAVVIHQTASNLGETPERWHSVPIHFGVTRGGKIIWLYDLEEVCNHASNADQNRRTIGIEIDGWYAGIEGRPETLWQPSPPPAKQRTPMDFPQGQADAVMALVRWIVDTVAAHGGKITHIHPHRQSSKDRESDPGSLIWKTIGLWAQQELGLSDGGANFTIGNGLKIPFEWDPRYVNNRY